MNDCTQFEFYAALEALQHKGALDFDRDLPRVAAAIERLRLTHTEDQITQLARDYRNKDTVCSWWDQAARRDGLPTVLDD